MSLSVVAKMETATRSQVSGIQDDDNLGLLDYGLGSLFDGNIYLSDCLEFDNEEGLGSSLGTLEDRDGAIDSSFPDGRTNQQRLSLASLQASHEQGRPPSQPQDLTQTRNASLHFGDELTTSWASHNHALTLPRFGECARRAGAPAATKTAGRAAGASANVPRRVHRQRLLEIPTTTIPASRRWRRRHARSNRRVSALALRT